MFFKEFRWRENLAEQLIYLGTSPLYYYHIATCEIFTTLRYPQSECVEKKEPEPRQDASEFETLGEVGSYMGSVLPREQCFAARSVTKTTC